MSRIFRSLLLAALVVGVVPTMVAPALAGEAPAAAQPERYSVSTTLVGAMPMLLP
jgi:hypothetical protein